MDHDRARVLIGGVGYTNLRDLSVGPVLVPTLARREWPSGVEVDDLGLGGPIALVHRLRATAQYERVVLFGAVARGRAPGRVYRYRWDGRLPDADEIQARVAEGVMGVISLDNLLVVGGFFAIWPPDVAVVEIEPRDQDWGPEFSAPVRAALGTLTEAVRSAALAPLDGVSTDPTAPWVSALSTSTSGAGVGERPVEE